MKSTTIRPTATKSLLWPFTLKTKKLSSFNNSEIDDSLQRQYENNFLENNKVTFKTKSIKILRLLRCFQHLGAQCHHQRLHQGKNH